jgi:signal transduction histidine kinase
VNERDAASIVAGRVRSVASSFFRFRAALVPPAALCAWLSAYATGAPRGQLFAMGAGMSLTSLFFLYEARRARSPMSDRRFALSLLVTLWALAMAALVTGAIESPMVSVLFAPTLTAFAAWGQRRRESVAVLLVFALSVALLFALRERAPFGLLPLAVRPWLRALFALVTVALLWSSVAGLADAYAQAAREIDRLREESVARVLERSRALDAVGATVAHEIKNPLAAIKGLVQLMARDERPERERERLRVIETEVARIDGVLRDYLAFARPLDPLRAERVALSVMVEGVLASLEPRAQRASVTFAREGQDVWVCVDRAKVEAALVNVALNAVQASPEGGVVRVSWRVEGESVTLTVHDDGRGIDSATLARVGTPFFTTRPDGTGLGLVVARGAIEQHPGGALRIVSREGAGTDVAITLKINASTQESNA